MTNLERPSDAELIGQARTGDEQAFRTLCERHAARLRSLVRKLLPARLLRKVSVSDVLQETYLTAYRRLDDYEDRGPGSFGSWLARILQNKVGDTLRRYAGTAKRGDVVEVSRDARRDTADYPGHAPSPSQVAIAAELKEQARAAMAKLPEDYREVLRLRQGEHLTLEEAAHRMGRTKDSVKKLYARALDRVAAELNVSGWRRGRER